MSWTRIGTVSVTNNSNAVVGTGTAFLTNSRIGDAFLGPDGVLYEVINVGSDTAISISPNYKGATNANAGYALIPVQGYPKALADSFNTINSQFGATLAALGNSGTASGIKTALGLDTTDGIAEGSTHLYFTQARVLATPLTALSVAVSTAVAATDSVLVGIGKLQAQVSSALPKAGGTLSGPVNDAPAPTIASAASIDIGAATSNIIAISGTASISALGTIAAGARRTLRFLGTLVLVYNVASLILPTGASITTAANDTAEFFSLGGGNWICLRYDTASGKPLTFSYDRSNVVGTVIQSGGLPTGALMEYVNNANGEAWKFACGSVIMVSTSVRSIIVGTPIGTASAMYYPGAASGGANRPVATVGTPFDWLTIDGGAGLNIAVPAGPPANSTYKPFFHLSLIANSAQNYTYSFLSIGRWF